MPDARTIDPTRCPACGLAATETETKALDATHAQETRRCANGHTWGRVVETEEGDG